MLDTAATPLSIKTIVPYLWRQIICIATIVAPPVLRIALALPFLRSAMTRWDGFLSLSAGTIYLFEEQFKLHIFGRVYDFPMPDQIAFLVAIAETTLPLLLLAGLGCRVAAFGLLVMTGVIQLVVPEGWANFHLYWAAIALAIISLDAGPLSLDRLISSIWQRHSAGSANDG